MTPREKAKDLIAKMQSFELTIFDNEPNPNVIVNKMIMVDAAQCALITVKIIIESLQVFGYSGTFYDCYYNNKMYTTEEKPPENYWQQVIIEIKKL